MILYKYTSAKIAIKILKNIQIRFTQPLAFNDPFDSQPFINSLYKENELENYAGEIFKDKELINTVLIQSMHKTLSEEFPGIYEQFDYEQLINLFQNEVIEKYDFLKSTTISSMKGEEFVNNVINRFIEASTTKTGILSLTTDPVNLLMWAHYADYHRGTVLEFDGDHKFFNQSDNEIYPAKIQTQYLKERPKIDFCLNGYKDPVKLFKGFCDIYFSKSTEWKYEAEYRVVRGLSDETNTKDKDINGFDIHLFPFPKELFKGIIFGNRISPNDEATIKKIIVDNDFKNILFKRIVLDKTEYKLNLFDC